MYHLSLTLCYDRMQREWYQWYTTDTPQFAVWHTARVVEPLIIGIIEKLIREILN